MKHGSAMTALLLGLTQAVAFAGVLHVDADATGAATGSTWSDAFPSLQDALLVAEPGDQIWVAEGRYRPDDGLAVIRGDWSASFELASGVSILGGFAGTEVMVAERAGLYETTILDGDLLDDDGPGFVNRGDNSFPS